LQGEQYSQTAAALRDGDLDAADLTPKQRLLLEFVETLTRHAYRITDEQVQGLREAGWSDAQIAEAVYDGALFNLFVRLADAFDIHPDPSFDAAGVPRVLSRPEGD
jgi:alkylhydroperoxidase family enzyme